MSNSRQKLIKEYLVQETEVLNQLLERKAKQMEFSCRSVFVTLFLISLYYPPVRDN